MKINLNDVLNFNCYLCKSNKKFELDSISLIKKNDIHSSTEEMCVHSCAKDSNYLYFNLMSLDNNDEEDILESMGILKFDISTNLIDTSVKRMTACVSGNVEIGWDLSDYSIASYRASCKCLEFTYFFVKNRLGNFHLQNITYNKNDAGINYMVDDRRLSIKFGPSTKLSKPQFIKTFNTEEKIKNFLLLQ